VSPIEVGQKAPMLTAELTDAQGQTHVIARALQRGPVILAIYKSSCQASKTIFPFLERLAQRFAGDGLTVLGVSQDSPNVTRSFARRYGITFPIIVEGDAYPVSRAYDIFATPTVFLINPNGTVAFTTMGFFKDQINQLGEAVATELGDKPEPLFTAQETDVPVFVPG
jgi:peroxiredoxin